MGSTFRVTAFSRVRELKPQFTQTIASSSISLAQCGQRDTPSSSLATVYGVLSSSSCGLARLAAPATAFAGGLAPERAGPVSITGTSMMVVHSLHLIFRPCNSAGTEIRLSQPGHDTTKVAAMGEK